MIPVARIEEMQAIDKSASDSIDILIERAGSAVAKAALQQLKGSHGHNVVILIGKGSNGADGRFAAKQLARQGINVEIIDAEKAPKKLPETDLVIDAAYGTGLRRPYNAPETNSPVLAVDLPSGVDGKTGNCLGKPLRAERTITFNALKPGHLFSDGSCLAGDIEVADIGLDVSSLSCGLVTDDDIKQWIPSRPYNSHKWKSACWVIAGSKGMEGAASLAVSAAQRAGSGYVRFSSPDFEIPDLPLESVLFPINKDLHIDESESQRFKAFVIGPGLGRSYSLSKSIQSLLEKLNCPVVVDGDGIHALESGKISKCKDIILTPHDGEFEKLTGSLPDFDRIDSVLKCAKSTGATILLKGATSVVANPEGSVRIINNGDQRLATAGSGDVLAGIIGAFLTRGANPLDAAAAGAHVHGYLLNLLPKSGVIASDLIGCLYRAVNDLGLDLDPKGD